MTLFPARFTGASSDTKTTSTMVAVMRVLLRAYHCARELRQDEWEFAVEVDVLKSVGASNTDLRSLQCKDYILQGLEQPRYRGRRRFKRVTSLTIGVRSCFVLTEVGRAAFDHLHAGLETGDLSVRDAARPVWDAQRKELRVGSKVVKRFLQPASSQERVLAAFEEERWPPRIFDPLPPVHNQDAKRRLHNTINNLNRSQDIAVIRFRGGGDGLSIVWQWCDRMSQDGMIGTGSLDHLGRT